MNTLHMPGFTAEASLFDASTRYQATIELEGVSHDGSIRLAQSDTYFPHDPPRVTPDLSKYYPRPVPCLLRTCIFWSPDNPSQCWAWLWSVGFVNNATGRCE